MKKEEYLLRISGRLRESKSTEFEQTIKFIFNHLPADCVRRNLDLPSSNEFQLSLAWRSIEALNSFKLTNEFILLKGALSTLAEAFESFQGKLGEIFLNGIEAKELFDGGSTDS